MPRKKPSLAQFSWDATPERLAKAANDNEIVHDKEANGAPVQRRRVADWPLARLRARGLLDADRRVNETLYEAGERFHADWHAAGLSPLGAIDYGREHVDGGALSGLNVSEFRIAALERYRRASACMGSAAAVVEAVVCQCLNIIDLASDDNVSGRTAQRRDMARLREGLHALAERYGTMKPQYVAASYKNAHHLLTACLSYAMLELHSQFAPGAIHIAAGRFRFGVPHGRPASIQPAEHAVR